MNAKPTVSVLFAGGGGDALGFTRAGFDLTFANDNNPNACDTLENKFGKKCVFKGNVKKMKTFKPSNVVCGGFPCQGFSGAGSRNIDDDRNTLYKELKRAISVIKPEFFVAENVKGFVTIGEQGGKFFQDGKITKLGKISQRIIVELSELGYKVQYKLHNACDYGVPQERERIVIVGVRDDLNFSFRFPKPSKTVTMLEYGVKDIPVSDDEIYMEFKGDRKDYFTSRYMQRDRLKSWDSLSYTIPATAKHVPPSPDCKVMWKYDVFATNGKPKDKDFAEFYRMHHQDVSPDLRRLSWRQCASIQGFPQDYVFYGDLESKYTQIGNAVPPPLMEKIAECIMPYFEGKSSSYKAAVQTVL